MALQKALFIDPLVIGAFGSIGAAYAAFDNLAANDTAGNPLGFAAVLIFTSTLNQNVYVSFDGTNDHFLVLANERRVIDLRANGLVWAGTVSVKHAGVAPTSGNLVLEVIRSAQ